MKYKKIFFIISFIIFLILFANIGNYIFEDNLNSKENSISNESLIYANNSQNKSDNINSNYKINITPKINIGNKTSININKVKLIPPKDNKIYFSAFPDFGGDEENVTIENIKNFEKLVNKNILWAPFSQYWFKGIVYPKEKIHIISNQGVIPLIRFMPRSSTLEYVKETKFTLENIILGKFDSDLQNWAIEAKKDNIPLLIDFGVEMNGKWFPWNGYWNGGGIKDKYGNDSYPDGPERYRDAYRHIIDIFRKENVNHVTWFFHPTMYSTEPLDEWNLPKYYYPGDDYIDWIGVSIYGPLHPKENYWDSFDEVLEYDNSYKKILNISSNKPFAILEMGVTDNHPMGDKSEWLKDGFESIINNKYIKFQAINYWHENWDNDGSITSLRLDSSNKVLKTFKEIINNDIFISKPRFSKNSEISKKKLLFKSGFEEGVYLIKPISDIGGIWWQELKGSDVQNFSWPININNYEGNLQLIIDYNKNISNYIENKIETEIGINNKSTKVLHQIIKNKQFEWSQDPYIIYTNNTEVENLYIKYSLKFPNNLVKLLGKNGWAVISEFKTTTDYRLALYVYEDENEQLYWYMHGDNVVLDDLPYEEYWFKENKILKVPVGEWFDFELYWHRSLNETGQVLWKINSEIVANYTGPTKLKDPINAIMIFTNYASNPIHQWIDNIEIWNQIPY